MRILCTGGAGYLGAVLVPMLLEHGHDIDVVDTFQHKMPSLLAHCHNTRLQIHNFDVRDWRRLRPLFIKSDIIIPLAALVGAPLCDRDTWAAETINAGTIKWICEGAEKEQTIIYPNTNSGYGTGGTKPCTEDSPINPLSLYARTKANAENAVLNHPQGISFRFATLFGCSPRMRLDLLVNDFTYRAVRDRALTLFEGSFRRNYLHVRDAASVFLFAIENAEEKKMFGEAFNVGLSSANLNKRELCQKIADHVPEFVYNEAPVGMDKDKRDYIVSNAKIQRLGYLPKHTLDDGIQELIKAFAMPLESGYRNT